MAPRGGELGAVCGGFRYIIAETATNGQTLPIPARASQVVFMRSQSDSIESGWELTGIADIAPWVAFIT